MTPFNRWPSNPSMGQHRRPAASATISPKFGSLTPLPRGWFYSLHRLRIPPVFHLPPGSIWGSFFLFRLNPFFGEPSESSIKSAAPTSRSFRDFPFIKKKEKKRNARLIPDCMGGPGTKKTWIPGLTTISFTTNHTVTAQLSNKFRNNRLHGWWILYREFSSFSSSFFSLLSTNNWFRLSPRLPNLRPFLNWL